MYSTAKKTLSQSSKQGRVYRVGKVARTPHSGLRRGKIKTSVKYPIFTETDNDLDKLMKVKAMNQMTRIEMRYGKNYLSK